MIRDHDTTIGDGDLRLREITPVDAPDLYRWRMEPATRAWFRDAEAVPYDAHRTFVAGYFAADNTDRWFVIETGGAVILCSMTTTLGYLALTLSMNLAIRSFGVAAAAGEICCVLAAVLVLPAWLVWRGRRLGAPANEGARAQATEG